MIVKMSNVVKCELTNFELVANIYLHNCFVFAFVNINNIVGVVQTKDGVGCIPEHKVGLNGIGTGEE